MKWLKLLTIMLVFAVACSDDDNPNPVEDPGYTVETTLSYVSGEYYGEIDDSNIAEYTMVISATYEEKEIMSVSEDKETTKKIKDVFHLTFLSEVSLDAEYPVLKEGKYTVSAERKIGTLWAGKSKLDNGEYAGSYVVSTYSGEAVKESKITGGFVDVSYIDGRLVLQIELQDENGYIPDKSDGIILKFNGTGGEAFSNKSGIEYIQLNVEKNEGGKELRSYNRCWYWGPSSSFRLSEDGEIVGEYLFSLSNGFGYEPENTGEVMTSFYLIDEYEFYGIDAKIKPGVYPVNTDSFTGVKGTLFKYDLTKDDVSRSSTVSVTTFDGGKYYVVDGYLAVFGDKEGISNRFVIHFTGENGEKFYARYDDYLNIGDEWTIASIRNDVNIDKFPQVYMWLNDPTWKYEQAGTNYWQLYLLGEGVTAGVDEYGYDIFTGPGDVIQIELSTDKSITDAIPVGKYEIKDTYEAGYVQQGNKTVAWIGIYGGAWYFRLEDEQNPDGSYNSSPGISGSLDISKEGGTYTIDVILHDDAKNTITAKYTGQVIYKDRRTSDQSAINRFTNWGSRYGQRFKDRQSSFYQNRKSERILKVTNLLNAETL